MAVLRIKDTMANHVHGQMAARCTTSGRVLRYADLIIRIRLREPLRLGRYPGTTLRGALGYALKKGVCVVPGGDCARCVLRSRCAYPAVFLGLPPEDRAMLRKYPAVPQPFVLRPGRPRLTALHEGDIYEFGIRLFGPAIYCVPYLIHTLLLMQEQGLGRMRARFTLERIGDDEGVVFDKERPWELHGPAVRLASLPEDDEARRHGRLRVEAVSPLRVRSAGRMDHSPSLSVLVRAAVRRYRIMTYFYGEGDERPHGDLVARALQSADQAEVCRESWQWYEVRRRSRSQQVEMPLGGAIGAAEYSVPDAAIVPWLRIAEVLHIGKATSFGFGQIQWQWSTRQTTTP